MFVELHYPESLAAQELDTYLANGWFRMGQSIFTTNFLRFQDKFYSSIWLRIDLKNFQTSPLQEKLKKLNAKFNVKIQIAKPNNEHETLFGKYRKSMTFEPAPSVHNLLYGYNIERSSLPIFSTYEIKIYDENKLIAVGFFDIGEKSAAGISCFYDPAYKKYSLGKYLMFLKIDFCKKNGFSYFYPGYFAPGYQLFDYKLELSKPNLQYLDLMKDAWRDFEEFSSENVPFDMMHNKLRNLCEKLKGREVAHQFQYYDFFDADMIQNLNGMGLFDFPVFIFCFDLAESEILIPLVVFDVRNNQYHLVICMKTYRSVFDESLPEHYNAYLLQITRYLYTGESADEMAEVIEMYGKEIAKV